MTTYSDFNVVDGTTYQYYISSIDINDNESIGSNYVNVLYGTATPVNIYDIQFTTDPSGDSPYNGQTVQTSGIVTAAINGECFIQTKVVHGLVS